MHSNDGFTTVFEAEKAMKFNMIKITVTDIYSMYVSLFPYRGLYGFWVSLDRNTGISPTAGRGAP
jgi:hypothetical protein